MKQKIKDLNNKYRVLISEVLPYELPLAMTNQQFYKNMQNKELREWFEGFIHDECSLYIPFNYNVRKNGGEKSRLLSVMHPFVQLKVADFYEKFDEYMIYLCNSRNLFSLRHIDKIAKCMFLEEEQTPEDGDDIQRKSDKIELDKDITDYDETKYKSYFTYKDYDMLYKFYNSFEYIRLEQKFKYFRTLDIASCFYHIYTHSIAWAIKSKEYAKKSLRKYPQDVFESDFDDLMQEMNYKETNGILVGPEISRIFAEIILQRIDLNVLEILKGKYKLSLHRDFEIKRYVDDYLAFAIKPETLETITQVYKEELEKYKLYLNSKKTETFERPFATKQAIAKAMIRNLHGDYVGKMHDKENNKYHAINARRDLKNYLSKFCALTKQMGVSYDMLNRYQMSLLNDFVKKDLDLYFQDVNDNKDPNILYNVLEICFYLFSLDMSTNASYKICRLIDRIYYLSKYDINVEEEVKQIISRETKRCLDIYQAQISDKDTNMEVMNLLLTIDGTIEIFFDVKYLKSLFGIEEEGDNNARPCKHLNYFQICTLLQIIKDKTEFSDIKIMIQEEVMKRFISHKNDWKSHTELVLLLFDWQTCPYIKNNDKLDLLKEIGCGDKVRGTFKNVEGWFFDWDCNHKIKDLLSKKEYHNIYE